MRKINFAFVIKYFPALLLITSVVMAAVGFATSPVLDEILWLPLFAEQTLKLFIVVAFAAIISCTITLKYTISPITIVGILLSIIAILFCGLVSVIIVVFFLLSCWSLGILILTVSVKLKNEIPAIILIGSGWAIYTVIFSILAIFPINTPANHTIILGLPIIMIFSCSRLRSYLLMSILSFFRQSRTGAPRNAQYFLGLIVITVMLSLHIALVSLPDRNYDALTTHLYIPSYMSSHLEWSFDANNYAQAFMPNGADMLYADMFMLGGEMSARLLNFTAFLLACYTTLEICSILVSPNAAIWSVALLISIPYTYTESSTLFVENIVSLFITIGVFALIELSFNYSILNYAAVVILMTGAAMVKLHGAIAALIISLLTLLYFYRRLNNLQSIFRVGIISIFGAAIATWPYMHALIKTGNPVFPLYNHIFKSPFFPPVEFVDSRWIGKLTPLILYKATFSTPEFVEAYSGALGFGFLIFLPAGIAVLITRPNRRALLSGGLGLLLIFFCAAKTQYLRYMLIFFPLLTVLVALALDYIQSHSKIYVPNLFLILFVIILNIFKIPSGSWSLATSDLRACCSDNLRHELELSQAPERIINRIVNNESGPSARVLYLNNPYGGLLTGTAIYSTWHNTKYGSDFSTVNKDSDFSILIDRIMPTHILLDRRVERTVDIIAARYLAMNASLMIQIGGLSLYKMYKK